MVGLVLLSSLCCLGLWLRLALGLVFLYFLFVKRQQPNTKDDNSLLPHGNMGWPFLGETLAFLKPHKSNTVGKFLQERCSRYGRVFKSHLFGCPTIVSCDQELNMFILQNEEKLFQCSYPKAIHGILGDKSLLVVVGDVHKKLRSFMLSFTNICKSRLEYLDDIDNLVTSIMDSWKEINQVMFMKEANKFTFNLMVKQILSLEPEDPRTSMILEEFLTFMKGLVSLPLYVPGTSYAKAVKARARISSTVRAIMEERRKEGGVGLGKGDFLDLLLTSTNLIDKEKVSIVADLLLAGYETTSTLLAMTVYFLGHSPNALNQLKEEHNGIRKEKQKREPLNWEDYKKMEFTQNVINEALRCGNIVKFVHRKAIKDVNFKGYFIPSGWKVLPIFTAVHLNPSLHENASEFNPWRWAGQGTSKNVQAFGGGVRLCPGAEIGKLETAFFLHHLVLNYRWRIKGEDYPVAYPYVEFKRGLPLEIEPI
ncbi:cytochrome P450 724B1-like [Telopea speciosissima]|uniref:cytochrome P450 724B1-like n=1 Tax=Telopea speciosissima TaxID=54955 RepID=UPI001CC4FC90|nr:cytochrome P450 724B1-like [Telopea speciosissima]